MQNILVLFILGFVFVNSVVAQHAPKRAHQFVEVKYHFGEPIIYSDSLSKTLTKPFYAFDIRWGIQSNGERVQDQLLGFPKFGLGFYHANLNSPDTLGSPTALYFFYSAPIVRWEKLSFNYDIALGASWGFSKFDFQNNNKNDLIGSNINAFFNGGVNITYNISPRFDIGAAVDFTHFSNGAINTPNKGLNLRGGNVFLRYSFVRRSLQKEFSKAQFMPKDIPDMKKYNVLSISTAVGGKATTANYQTGPIYFTSSSVIDYFRAYSIIGKYGAGLDLFYDNSLSEDYIGLNLKTPTYKYSFVGIHLSHEFVISKVSVVTEAGTYIYKGSPAKGWFFFRLQLRYYIQEKLFASFALKTANGFKADYIEMGLGYNIKW